MGKKTDLINIYETYKNEVVEELNIGVPQGGPALHPTLDAQPTNDHMVGIKIKDEDSEHLPCNEPQEDNNTGMAKSETFSILKNANDLMNLLQTVQKVEPWQLSKLVKANDYITSLKNSLEYDEFEKCQKDMQTGMNDIANGMVVVSKIKDMLTGEDMGVNEEVLKQVIFNIECLKENN